MKVVIIHCPKCDAENSFLLSEPSYKGLFRCWKCGKPFVLTVEDGELESCKPISEEKFKKSIIE